MHPQERARAHRRLRPLPSPADARRPPRHGQRARVRHRVHGRARQQLIDMCKFLGCEYMRVLDRKSTTVRYEFEGANGPRRTRRACSASCRTGGSVPEAVEAARRDPVHDAQWQGGGRDGGGRGGPDSQDAGEVEDGEGAVTRTLGLGGTARTRSSPGHRRDGARREEGTGDRTAQHRAPPDRRRARTGGGRHRERAGLRRRKQKLGARAWNPPRPAPRSLSGRRPSPLPAADLPCSPPTGTPSRRAPRSTSSDAIAT